MQCIQQRPCGRFRRTRNDEGLTLVEVIVSISLLGIFAITFAPILYTSLSVTSSQATIAFAAQRAASYIDDARERGAGSCQGLDDETPVTAPTQDPRDVWVKVSSVIEGCSPAPTTPTAVTLTVTACEAAGVDDTDACVAGDRRLTVVSTKIMVNG